MATKNGKLRVVRFDVNTKEADQSLSKGSKNKKGNRLLHKSRRMSIGENQRKTFDWLGTIVDVDIQGLSDDQAISFKAILHEFLKTVLDEAPQDLTDALQKFRNDPPLLESIRSKPVACAYLEILNRWRPAESANNTPTSTPSTGSNVDSDLSSVTLSTYYEDSEISSSMLKEAAEIAMEASFSVVNGKLWSGHVEELKEVVFNTSHEQTKTAFEEFITARLDEKIEGNIVDNSSAKTRKKKIFENVRRKSRDAILEWSGEKYSVKQQDQLIHMVLNFGGKTSK